MHATTFWSNQIDCLQNQIPVWCLKKAMVSRFKGRHKVVYSIQEMENLGDTVAWDSRNPFMLSASYNFSKPRTCGYNRELPSMTQRFIYKLYFKILC